MLVRTAVLIASALLASTADAHGYLAQPAPTFIASAKTKPNFWAYGVYAAKNPPAASYAGTQSEADLKKREQTFDTNFKKNGLTSLKKWIMENQVDSGPYQDRPAGGTPECGFSDPNGKQQALPAQLRWMGTTFQHPGPCEAWCDDEMVIPYQASCNAYAKQGLMDYDKAACTGKKMLTFYYLAVHVAEPFQVYASCVPLQGAAAGAGSNTAKNSTAPASTPKATPAPAPAATPAAPAATRKTTTTAPAPASAPEAPAADAGAKKCKRRM